MCMVAYELKRGNPVGLILVGTLNGLDAFSEEGNKLHCRKSSSSSGIIPSFCLCSQPSRIPLILHGLPWGFQPIEAPYITFHLCLFIYFFHLCSPLFFFLPLFSPFFFPYRFGYKKGFCCFILLLCPSIPTFLGTLGIAGFEMSWVLKPTWSLWVA